MEIGPMLTKPKVIGYWVTTALLAAALLAGGAAELASAPAVVASTVALGYPAYVLTIVGIWKLLSAPALLAPRLPRLKEWAYAGIFFDFTGAAASHAFSGDTSGKIASGRFARRRHRARMRAWRGRSCGVPVAVRRAPPHV